MKERIRKIVGILIFSCFFLYIFYKLRAFGFDLFWYVFTESFKEGMFDFKMLSILVFPIILGVIANAIFEAAVESIKEIISKKNEVI